MIIADIDLERLAQDRMRLTSFQRHRRPTTASASRAIRRIPFEFRGARRRDRRCIRDVERFPYVPERPGGARRALLRGLQHPGARADEAAGEHRHREDRDRRLRRAGLDACADRRGADDGPAGPAARPTSSAYTMPGFATSDATLSNAHGADARAGRDGAGDRHPALSCLQMLRDIGHPFAEGEPVYDITFENVQAGERTSHLFRLANFHNGLVLGTGDLSELALGWATYGVGDHMSHYNVNASVPKTLIQYLIRWVIDTRPVRRRDRRGAAVASWTRRSRPSWCRTTEATTRRAGAEHAGEDRPVRAAGLQLYYITRYGFRPSKVAFLAHHAWGDRARGALAATCCRRRSATSTTWPRSRSGWRSSCTASSRSASSSARRCPTARRSAPAARSRRAATGARPATPRRRCGWRSCGGTCRRGPHPRPLSRKLRGRGEIVAAGSGRLRRASHCVRGRPPLPASPPRTAGGRRTSIALRTGSNCARRCPSPGPSPLVPRGEGRIRSRS